jgi:hypothetical protein
MNRRLRAVHHVVRERAAERTIVAFGQRGVEAAAVALTITS